MSDAQEKPPKKFIGQYRIAMQYGLIRQFLAKNPGNHMNFVGGVLNIESPKTGEFVSFVVQPGEERCEAAEAWIKQHLESE